MWTEIGKPKSNGVQAIETDMCGVTLAIVMELCRLGSFYKLIEQARRVAHLPLEVRTGARCPSTPDMAKVKVTPLSLSLFPNSPLDFSGLSQGSTLMFLIVSQCYPSTL